ncbi:MAG: alpha/beta fold hydrolase [Metamycoplasmataceae bacterium]
MKNLNNIENIRKSFGSYNLHKNNENRNTKNIFIFIHDFATGSDDFDKFFVNNFSNEEYYSIQLPGHGKEEIKISLEEISIKYFFDYCVGIIEKLNLKNFILIGHSFGGLLAVRLSNYFKKKVIKVILISPLNSTITPQMFIQYFKKLPKNFDETLNYKNNLYFNLTKTLSLDIEDYISKESEFHNKNYDFLKKLKSKIYSFSNILSCKKEEMSLSNKTLIISGKHDKIVSKNSIIFAFKKASRPFIQIDIFDNSSHVPFLEEPQKFYEILKEFIY